ncbi:Gamma-aminobutyric acid type B receptor subunit 2, partial [Geodia barretti]
MSEFSRGRLKCNREVALDAFYKQMKYLPTKIGWVASGCSLATQAIAELTHFYNITQLSCISSSPALRNRMRYRYYFQLLASNVLVVHGFFGMIKYFGWKRVRLIAQDEEIYASTMDALKEMLEDYTNVEYSEVRFGSNQGFSSITAF